MSGGEAGCVALLGSSADILEPCVGNGGGTGMLRGDGCDFGRQGGGRFSDERCIAGTGAAVSGDEAGCAALGSGDGTGVVRGKTARGHTRSSMSHMLAKKGPDFRIKISD